MRLFTTDIICHILFHENFRVYRDFSISQRFLNKIMKFQRFWATFCVLWRFYELKKRSHWPTLLASFSSFPLLLFLLLLYLPPPPPSYSPSPLPPSSSFRDCGLYGKSFLSVWKKGHGRVWWKCGFFWWTEHERYCFSFIVFQGLSFFHIIFSFSDLFSDCTRNLSFFVLQESLYTLKFYFVRDCKFWLEGIKIISI